MWFKNIFVYRLATDWAMSATTMEEKLSLHPLQTCAGLDKQSR